MVHHEGRHFVSSLQVDSFGCVLYLCISANCMHARTYVSLFLHTGFFYIWKCKSYGTFIVLSRSSFAKLSWIHVTLYSFYHCEHVELIVQVLGSQSLPFKWWNGVLTAGRSEHITVDLLHTSRLTMHTRYQGVLNWIIWHLTFNLLYVMDNFFLDILKPYCLALLYIYTVNYVLACKGCMHVWI